MQLCTSMHKTAEPSMCTLDMYYQKKDWHLQTDCLRVPTDRQTYKYRRQIDIKTERLVDARQTVYRSDRKSSRGAKGRHT